MWFRDIKKPPQLTEELVQRVWDCSSRLKQLEDRFDAQLTELSIRYRRAEQSEKRLTEKKAKAPCDDLGADPEPLTLAHRAFAYGSASPGPPNGEDRATNPSD